LKSSKRILIVIGSFKTGGAERMSITMGTAWLNLGYDVHYALLRPIFEIPNNVPNNRIHLLSKRIGRSTGYQHFKNLLRIFLLNQRLNADVVVGFTYFSSMVACFSFCKNIIGTFDVFPYQFAKKRARIANFVIKWPFVKKIICPSKGLLDQINHYQPLFRKKGISIYNTLDFEGIIEMSKGKTELETIDEPYIAAMGRFSYQKNFQLLLEAFSKSKIRQRNKLVLIGDGSLKSEISGLIDRYGLSNSVILTGFINNPFPIIKKAELFVNTSNYESFCMVLLEALALNVPVLATDCKSGPSEIVIDDLNGRLIPVNDERALIAAFNSICENPEVLDVWKSNIPYSIEKFKIDSIMKEWEKII
jgi:GalNAc-alpha-(1->4)-GalNAc-alpha-(1->3)-diNAcBac-PP-undecaprenol alpha-1,4-N-acetyl-D-galactosaminyltransferase